jgi:trehalose 6-phosphate phosphatase
MRDERSAQPTEAPLPAPPALRPDHALFLDFDGTLAEIAPTPDRVKVRPDLPRLLTQLAYRLGGAIAVVSGRPLDELAHMVAPFRGAMAGQHGLERRHHDGHITRRPAPPGLDRFRSILARYAADRAGLLFEDKGASLALHYRQAPFLGQDCRALIKSFASVSNGELEALDGKMVVELRSRLGNKGRAIVEFLSEPPFLGRVPVFVGDDITDEDGFAIVDRSSGISVHVGSGATIARYRVAGVADVLAWLASGLSSDGLLLLDFNGAPS